MVTLFLTGFPCLRVAYNKEGTEPWMHSG